MCMCCWLISINKSAVINTEQWIGIMEIGCEKNDIRETCSSKTASSKTFNLNIY